MTEPSSQGTQGSARPVALVTGASRGIGLAIARALAEAGHDLTVSARGAERLAKEAAALSATGVRVHPVAADMADPGDVARLAQAHADTYDRLDVLVLGAGVGFAAPIGNIAPKRLALQFAVNVHAPFALVQALLPLLRTTAAGRPSTGAKIIALASITGRHPEPNLAAYAATKAALISLCHSVNIEASAAGVSATAICPGYVDTDMAAYVRDQIPQDEMITVGDIAELALAVTRLSAHAVVPEIVVTRPGEQLHRA